MEAPEGASDSTYRRSVVAANAAQVDSRLFGGRSEFGWFVEYAAELSG